jgi:poly(ADP-ribose) glycohydrolase ARH3
MSKEQIEGALLGTLIGDCMGAPFEAMPAEAIPQDRPLPLGDSLGAGETLLYTDDTEMMLSVAEELAENRQINPTSLARRFLKRFSFERGYGRQTTQLILSWKNDLDPKRASLLMDGQGSLGNGASMRISPVGVYFAADAEMRPLEAKLSALVTHTNPLGYQSAQAQAEAVSAAMRGDDVFSAALSVADEPKLNEILEAAAELDHLTPIEAGRSLGNTVQAHQSVPLAIYVSQLELEFAEMVSYAIQCGGDTDTIAAMASAIRGARDGSSIIPEDWLDVVEGDAVLEIRELSDKLSQFVSE